MNAPALIAPMPQNARVRFGQSKKLKEEQRNLARLLIKEGNSILEVARTFDVHSATLCRIIVPKA